MINNELEKVVQIIQQDAKPILHFIVSALVALLVSLLVNMVY